MTREEILRSLEALPEAEGEPTIRAMAHYLRMQTYADDPATVLIDGIASMARQLRKTSGALLAQATEEAKVER